MWIFFACVSAPAPAPAVVDVLVTGPGARPGIAVEWMPAGEGSSWTLGFTDDAGAWSGPVPGPGALLLRDVETTPASVLAPDAAASVVFEARPPRCATTVTTTPGARVVGHWYDVADPAWLGDADAAGHLGPVAVPCGFLADGEARVLAFGPAGWGAAPAATGEVHVPTPGRTARVHGTFTWADGRPAALPLEVGVARGTVDPATEFPRQTFALPQPVVDGAWSAWLPTSGGIDLAAWTTQGEGSAWFPFAPDADAPAHLVVETAQGVFR